MKKTIIDYYNIVPHDLNFIYIPEKSKSNYKYYKMCPDFGVGDFWMLDFKRKFLVIIADFIPFETLEKVSNIKQDYIEISQFETTSSYFRVSNKKINNVNNGIFCYVNTNKTIHVFCKKNQPTKFIKIILTKEYFDGFLKSRYDDSYDDFKNAINYILTNPVSPQLNYVFQQIKNCRNMGPALNLYIESKVLEVLSLVTHNLNQRLLDKHIPVKLSKEDKICLKKVIEYFENNICEYPSIQYISKIANMSSTRLQMAFKKYYGITPYKYLKNLRLSISVILLLNTDDNIQLIAENVGYNNAGHFAGIFKKTYGTTPKNFRKMHYVD